ncbi:MAG: hypothetical protein RLZZ435_1858 [Cyanobacteriota bacterium]|jgi:hypothetical protein
MEVVVASSPDMQIYQQQFISGSEKKRREALESLLKEGAEGIAFLEAFLVAVREGKHPLDSVAGRVYAKLLQCSEVEVQTFLQTKFPQGLVDSSSDRNLEYQDLETLLATEQFEAADRLTIQKMCELAGTAAQQRKWLYFSEVDLVPQQDLQSLDRLWRIYSDDKFGFSVQREIWLGVGQSWDKLWPKIGWKNGNIWTRYPQGFTWNLSAPKGHLPLTNQLRGVRVMAALMAHSAFQKD